MPSSNTKREFFTRKDRRRYYKTVELWHPSFGPTIPGPQRFVTGQFNAIDFMLEPEAPRSPNQMVRFDPGGFSYKQPEQGGSFVRLDVTFGAVFLQAYRLMRLVKEVRPTNPGELIIREYLEGEEGLEPFFKLRLFLTSVSIVKGDVVARGEQDNPSDLSVASIITAEDFPGMAEAI